jgi:BMFP domain-containing protein YqiC
MPWFAWIVIVAILIFGLIQVISMATGRPLAADSESEEVKKLKKRIEELEASQAPQEIEDRTPTKSEVNLAAEDRWRIAMLEARLEEVEKNRKNKEDGEDPEPDNALA